MACARLHLLLLLGFALLVTAPARGAGADLKGLQGVQPLFRSSDGRPLDAPYIATPGQVVEQLLALAQLREGDVVYDLGCGDGRIVTEAAKRPGVRAVGIDLDPARIAEGRARARAAGVADRAKFLQQDLFDADIREATVLVLFLGSEINVRLRPKLFRDLRPGTRVVSHLFTMGDWKADSERSLWLWDDGLHDLYLWVIPANLSGVWTGKCGKEVCTLTLNQQLQSVRGTLAIDSLAFSITPANLRGNTVQFEASRIEGGRKRTILFEGRMENHVLEGVLREAGGGPRAWKGTRDPATVSWIE